MSSRVLRSLLSLTALFFLGLAAGCSDDATSPATLTQDEADDLATQIASTLALDNGGTLAVLPTLDVGETPAAKTAPPPTDGETTIGGFTYHYQIRFFNAAGDTMASYDPLLTVRLQTQLRAAGEITTLRYQAQVQHRSQFEVQGVNALADSLKFNGTCSDTCQSSFTALMVQYQRHFRLESQAQVQDVAYLKPVESGELPCSGVMTWQMTAARYRDAARTQLESQLRATVTVRFTGGDTAELEVEGGWTYQLNLRTGVIVRT
jgi:hypothetical protein